MEVCLQEDSRIAAKEDLFFSHRNDATLVVEPESASWAVLDRASFDLLGHLGAPLSLRDLESMYSAIEPQRFRGHLLDLFRVQCISIDGRLCHNPEELWRKRNVFPYFINIHLTSRCNFACRYCYNSMSTIGEDMTLETAKYIQKRLFLESPSQHLTFQFHGGEPLILFYDVVVPFAKSAAELSRKYGKTSRVLLQSNGSLITEDMARIIKEMDMGLGISLDGDEASHNEGRVYPDGRGTYRESRRGLQRLLNLGKHTAPLACIHEPAQYAHFIDYFVNEGISDFVIRPAYPFGRGKESKGITPENAASFAREFLKTLDRVARQNRGKTLDFYAADEKEKRRTVFRNITYYLELLISRERPNMCFRSPCGAGNCIISFNTKGDIYPCEEMVVHDKFKIGNIYQRDNIATTILESNAYRTLNGRLVEHLEGCRQCPWRRFCGGGCPSKIAASNENLDYGDYYCAFNKVVLEECAWKIAEDPSIATGNLTLDYLCRHPVDSSLWKLSLKH
jgi:uncharacterized protein